MARSTAVSIESSPSSNWLFGPGIDLVVGCGLGYLVVFTTLVAIGPSIKVWIPLTLLPLLALVAGAPHYGATLLRVYRNRDDRRRYASVASGATLALAAAFLLSLKWYALGSFLVSLYLLWSPWHYAAQNYGLALMFLGRRQVPVDPLTRKILRSTFILPFLIFTMQVSGEGVGSLFGPYGASNDVMPPLYRSVPIGIPGVIQSISMWLLMTCYSVAVIAAVWRIVRASSFGRVIPTLALIGSQALWFVFPACARYWNLADGVVPLEAQSSAYAFQWVAAAHASQYMWITIYFNKKAGSQESGGRFYLGSLLAGHAIWAIPAFVFAPALGAGLATSPDLLLLVAAVVNLHHFILDGAIWKLRDSKIKAVLVKSTTAEVASHMPSHRRWLWTAVVLLASIIPLVQAAETIERYAFSQAKNRGDLARAELAMERLDWMGRSDSSLLVYLGLLAGRQGEEEVAYAAYRRSAAALDNPSARYELARYHLGKGEWQQGADHFELAYGLSNFFSDQAVSYFAEALIRAGRLDRAREVLEAGRASFPDNRRIEGQLLRLEERSPSND